MTTYRVPTVERAYQLARSGDFANVAELKARLKAEGYGDADAQLAGPFIRRQLTKLCAAAMLERTALREGADEARPGG